MATTEYIKKRVDGKKAEIEKLNKKMTRILDAQASGWEKNPYWYSESDIKSTQREIDRATEALKKWEDELAKSIEKDNSRNVKPVIEFLDMWKSSCHEWYMKGLTAYYDEKAVVQAAGKKRDSFQYGSDEYIAAKAEFDKVHDVFWCKVRGYFETKKVKGYNGVLRDKEVKVREGEYEKYAPYTGERTLAEAEEKLNKDLEIEANRKYDDIIERTNEVVGEITDVSWLSVDPKGNLNGFIIGTRGNAKVETIGAGGYNIQCFHFRCLIHAYNKPISTKVASADKVTSKANKTADKAAETPTDYKSMSIEELKQKVEEVGGTCKVYENEAIYRMRLVMAIKKAMEV